MTLSAIQEINFVSSLRGKSNKLLDMRKCFHTTDLFFLGLYLTRFALSIQKPQIWWRILAAIITQINHNDPLVQTPGWMPPNHALTPKYSMPLYPPNLRIPRTLDCHHHVNHGRDPAQLCSVVGVSPGIPSELDLSYNSWHCFYSPQTNYFFPSTKCITAQVLLHSEVFL